jgi:stage II sporulation protein GA (sporulation sigma-E factor processing peptidase)
VTVFLHADVYTCLKEAGALEVVYVDVVVLINTAANYIIMLLTGIICDERVSRLKMLAAAFLGGVYSACAIVPKWGFLELFPVKIAVSVVMLLIVFGGKKRLLKTALVFYGVSAALGGMVYAASLRGGVYTPVGLGLMAGIFLLAYIVISAAFRRAAKKKPGGTRKVEVRYGGKTAQFTALVDTGNSLKDPVTGQEAIIMGAEDIACILPAEIKRAVLSRPAADAMEIIGRTEAGTRFRLLPYSAVGVSGGLLLAFRPEELYIDGEKKSGVLIAISPNRVSDGAGYSALIGG